MDITEPLADHFEGRFRRYTTPRGNIWWVGCRVDFDRAPFFFFAKLLAAQGSQMRLTKPPVCTLEVLAGEEHWTRSPTILLAVHDGKIVT